MAQLTGGIREYARYRGVSHTSVRKAILAKRIHLADGVIDFAAADVAWKSNTTQIPRAEQEAQASRCKPKVEKPARPNPTPIDSAPGPNDDSLIGHRTRREKAEADIAEIRAQKARLEVIETAEARRTFRAIGRMYSAGREQLFAQLAPRLVGKSDLSEIEGILKQALRATDERIMAEITKTHEQLLAEAG